MVDFKEVPICEACRSLSRSSPDAERADEISWLKSLGVADMQYNVKVGSVEYLAVSVSSKFYCKSFDEREIEENYRSVTDSSDYRSVISETSLHSRSVIDSEISAAVQEVRDKMGSLCYFSNLEWEQHREAVKTIVLRDLRKVEYIKYSDCILDSISKEEATVFYRDNCIRDKKESDIAISIKRDGDVVAIVDLEYIDREGRVDLKFEFKNPNKDMIELYLRDQFTEFNPTEFDYLFGDYEPKLPMVNIQGIILKSRGKSLRDIMSEIITENESFTPRLPKEMKTKKSKLNEK